jgi:hypothetical protein
MKEIMAGSLPPPACVRADLSGGQSEMPVIVVLSLGKITARGPSWAFAG